MLELRTNLAYAKGLKGRVLDSATLLRENTPREWLCHSNEYMILVRWQQGILGLGVGETEMELYRDIKIIGVDKDLLKTEDKELSFKIIKEFMDWTIDDDAWFE